LRTRGPTSEVISLEPSSWFCPSERCTGIDLAEGADYLGDGPWDMAASTVDKIKALIMGMQLPSEEELRTLFRDRVIPKAFERIKPEAVAELLRAVDEMWSDVDWCYEEDWQRPAHPAERQCVCEYAVKQMMEVEASA
jgi:hypothetical protein